MPEDSNDNDFKIIAIKAGPSCLPEFYKVLEKTKAYFFYPGYDLDDNDNYKKFPSAPEKLFSIPGGPTLNISAIAGQNGSGKSTIIELLFMAMNNLAKALDIKGDLQLVEGLEVSVFFKRNGHYRFHIKNSVPELHAYDDKGVLTTRNLYHKKLEMIQDFFYTVAVNYSHYAYNSLDIKPKAQKDWLKPLFHKNDSYQTPIVINPYRNKGVININTENELVSQRLMTNLVRQTVDKELNFRQLTDNLKATDFVLRLNESKDTVPLYEEREKQADGSFSVTNWLIGMIDPDFEKVLVGIDAVTHFGYVKDSFAKMSGGERYEALHYLVRKLITMSVKYSDYHGYFKQSVRDFDWGNLQKYVEEIMADPSHIAFKFKQTINYLKYPEINKLYTDKRELPIEDISQAIIQLLGTPGITNLKPVELLPPPIFIVDILLLANDDKGKKITFDTLSSGEKQLVYSVSSILYHLINLESVASKKDKPKRKYNFINIIFEEIELYFHPEIQRRYIKYLRDSISRLSLKKIHGINLIFVTHSPFILSDIPNDHIMFLKVAERKAVQFTQEKKTFGANIHNLLNDAFFMTNGFCGAFAIEKITLIIDHLNLKRDLKKLELQIADRKKKPSKMAMPHKILSTGVLDADNLKIEEEEEKKQSDLKLEIAGIDSSGFPAIIDMIGEPIVARKLREMIAEVDGRSQEDQIRDEIARLQKLLPTDTKLK
ncbi:AAA ATPase domain-containing protein [Mucilaginibacter pineti]|uniref:AAA ATPase domain-containing protein n=1 Tax=Mucilaginibacter pineti TaxID=1391627 RepID=A0A1G7ILL3_9SPHI|nr:AAA family ATPase [Mucilaginibacter pineti]SDF13620.1 AAA ATPase domain-containing protein [Mucilaginibacter pineti]